MVARFFLLVVLLFLPLEFASAIEHPACIGKENNACDAMALLVNAKGMGCYKLLAVVYVDGRTYILTCELASYDRSWVTYDLKFSYNQESYTVSVR